MCSGKTLLPSSRCGPDLDVEVLSDHSSSQPRRKVIISDHDIAVIRKDCYRDHALIHNVPLLKAIISSRSLTRINTWSATGISYSRHTTFDELPLD